MVKVHPVPRLWPGETFVCIASGPSLTREDVEAVRGRARVIAVNRSIELAPWADVWYAADAQFWKWVYRSIGDYAPVTAIAERYEGRKYTVTKESTKWPGVTLLGRGSSDGLSLDPMKICLGGNSGYQAINLAVLLGASRIVLLGYDMQLGTRGKRHWHSDHPPAFMNSPLQTFRQHFPTLVRPLKDAGVSIVNCSRATALTCFERQTIEDVFPVSVEAVA
jgi:hypothetical protein